MATDKRQEQLLNLRTKRAEAEERIKIGQKEVESLGSQISTLATAIARDFAKEWGVDPGDMAEKSYIDPDDPYNPEPWKGVGRMPKWLKDKIKHGHSKDEFLKR